RIVILHKKNPRAQACL
ncbi:hypothetical protein CP8484711_1003, partial [Chlamydia psittaci 84-8471/1]